MLSDEMAHHNTDARKVYVSINSNFWIIRCMLNTVKIIDAAVQLKNCLVGPQNTGDVQLFSFDHLKELLARSDPLALVAITKGIDEAQKI